ncbi:MAG: transposase [Acidobacteriota bacterium]
MEGLSIRKATSMTGQLCGLEVSKSRVSEPASKVDAEIGPWRGRFLRGTGLLGSRRGAGG